MYLFSKEDKEMINVLNVKLEKFDLRRISGQMN